MPTHLLTVWNPLIRPETIEDHVLALRQHGRTWWARLRRPSDGKALTGDAARARWPDLVAVSEELVGTGRSVYLFLTDFSLLHVAKVDAIRWVEPLPAEELATVPEYERAPEGLEVPIWFRVTDLRALSYDRMVTLSRLRTLVYARDKSPFGYDPFAAKMVFDYPLCVTSPELDDLFHASTQAELAAAEGKGGAARFADLDETIHEPALRNTFDELQGLLGPTWSGLERFSQITLATSRVVERKLLQAGSHFDAAAVFNGIHRALERELVIELLKPLVVRRVEDRELAQALSDAKQEVSLGSHFLLKKLKRWAAKEKLGALEALVGDESALRWLGQVTRLRNPAAHAQLLSDREVRAVAEEVYASAASSRLSPIVSAKHDVKRWLTDQRKA